MIADFFLGILESLMMLPSLILPTLPAPPVGVMSELSKYLGIANFFAPIDFMLSCGAVWASFYGVRLMYRLWMMVKP